MSEVPFQEILEELKPEFILALAFRLWDRLPDLDGREGPKIEPLSESRTWFYPYSGGEALLFCIMHPSAGFSPLVWHRHILIAFEKAKEFHKKNITVG